jgi:hypothetical protein
MVRSRRCNLEGPGVRGKLQLHVPESHRSQPRFHFAFKNSAVRRLATELSGCF